MKENEYKNTLDKISISSEKKNDLANNVILKNNSLTSNKKYRSRGKQAAILIVSMLLVYSVVFSALFILNSEKDEPISNDISKCETSQAGQLNGSNSSENSEINISLDDNAQLSNEELINKYSTHKDDYKWDGRVWTGQDVLWFVAVEGRYDYTNSMYSYSNHCSLYAYGAGGSYQIGLKDNLCYWVDVNSEKIKPAKAISLFAEDESGKSFEMDTYRVRKILFDESGCFALVDYSSGYHQMWCGDQKYTEEQGKENDEKDSGLYIFEVDEEGNFEYKSRFLLNCKDSFNSDYIAPDAQRYKIEKYKLKDDRINFLGFSYENNKFEFSMSYIATEACQEGINYIFDYNISFSSELKGLIYENIKPTLKRITIGNLTEFTISPSCFVTDEIKIYVQDVDMNINLVATITDKDTIDKIILICSKVDEYTKAEEPYDGINDYWIDFGNNIMIGGYSYIDYGNIYNTEGMAGLRGDEKYILVGNRDNPDYNLPYGLNKLIKNILEENQPETNEYIPKTRIPLNEEQIKEIKSDYIEYLKENEAHVKSLTVSDIIIRKHYGPYSGCYALFISHSRHYDFVLLDASIGGYDFLFSNNQPLLIYKNSTFVDLETAYESGMISKDDLKDLAWYFRSDRYE